MLNVDDAVNLYQSSNNNPHFEGEVHLVIDFVSRSTLEQNLNNLKDGIPFARRREAIQILWFVSSLISSSHEVNKDGYVHCKPWLYYLIYVFKYLKIKIGTIVYNFLLVSSTGLFYFILLHLVISI
ncbi:hypothetical protein [Flavobacterium sp. LHD-85]|uniref:hypothetical protein n=1 Tax=Flavobacterium sp. LHD-85 TaxID=3071410 RepID=UPI0027DF008D|nr:hypothetical protein [Flavobacterium sp. LHD-85]MDQ6531994.1 hypothetical protein [Flavobacterium sp. LHD-85]